MEYLAFDLGAESGRAVVARFENNLISLKEAARFPNGPVAQAGSLRWDVLRLWSEMRHVLEQERFESVGVDTWGVDYALLGEHGQLLENPFHYRDHRTDGMVEEVCGMVGRERIYELTGIQFMPINTLYQFYAGARQSPRMIEAANALVTIPDLFNYWMTGEIGAEYTNATTTQFVNARTRGWATEIFEALDLPVRLLPRIFEPGETVGRLSFGPMAGTPVIAPACHDTGSAVAAVETAGRAAFLSSGTWSLLGTEVTAPVLTPRALDLNFTNEGGVCGTTRLLKNIGGLWLLQSCRRVWAASGHEYSYADLLAGAESETRRFACLIDPDWPAFHGPENMVAEIDRYCARTGQAAPESPGCYTRAILESLAFKYRYVLESLEELTGQRLGEIRIIGGGAKNRLLNQLTADATGRAVVAGPVEATALGNVAMQMVATGAVSSIGEARRVIERSFPVDRYAPEGTERWDREYGRFRDYVSGGSGRARGSARG